MSTVQSVAARLQELADGLVDTLGVPGVSIGIARDEDVATFGVGVTSIEDPIAVTPATRFQVGSITKTLTSAAVLLLVQQGRVALEDPVSDHLQGQELNDLDLSGVTIIDLLAHRLGIDGDHLFTHGSAGGLATLRDAARLFPAGEGYSYSNAGFSLAGAVIEAVSGVSYERFVSTGLLAPLGMDSSAFTADEVITHRVASPHATIGDSTFLLRGFGWQPGWEHTAADRPAAGLISTIEDVVEWGRFQWSGAERGGPLDPESFTVLHEPVIAIDAVHRGALDWFVRDIDGIRALSHGGVTVGYVSELLVVPEERVAIAVLTNGANGDGLIHEIRREALHLLFGVSDSTPEPDRSARLDEHFGGTYLHSFAQLELSAGPEPATVQLVESPRPDSDELWQPPSEGAVIADIIRSAEPGAGEAVVRDVIGSPRYLRWGRDRSGRRWLQWRGRRAPRIDGTGRIDGSIEIDGSVGAEAADSESQKDA